MDLYQLKNITHAYGGRPVLTIDRLNLPAGTLLGLCGPNGSGKSTLLRLLGFVERPDRGTIQFNGRPAALFDDHVRGKVALLPQSAYLLKRSVSSNVAYGLRIAKDRRDAPARIRHALSLVGLAPDQFAQRPWFALSGGEARRVALAARLVLHPRVLLLDEPTASVDAASAHLIKEAAIEAHRQWGTSLIIASHDLPWLQDFCHDTLHLFRGNVLGRGRRTLLFGPWQNQGNGALAMALTEDQHFVAANAPADLDNAVAAIDARHLSLHAAPQAVPPHKARLQGTVTTLGLETASDRITASIAVGRVLFTVYLPAEALSGGRFAPGSKAWIAYPPEEVQWY